jgi:hypothetical protein
MSRAGNFLKLSLAAILGFCVGIIICIVVACLILCIPGSAGGWLFVYAIILSPFWAIPLAVFFGIAAMGFVKTKIDKVNLPSEKNFNTIIFAVIISMLVILMIIARVSGNNWIKSVTNKSHSDGIQK